MRGALDAMLTELADELGGDVKLIRQHRDLRFSADRRPYKTRTYGLIVDRPDGGAVLYAEVSATGLFAGTGVHTMDSGQLARFRAAVADDTTGPALERALGAADAAGAETFGEALKTAPRGYPRDHPRVRLLRHRALVAGRRLAPGDGGIAAGAALEHARTTWAACAPMNAWLGEHVGAAAEPRRARGGRARRSPV